MKRLQEVELTGAELAIMLDGKLPVHPDVRVKVDLSSLTGDNLLRIRSLIIKRK